MAVLAMLRGVVRSRAALHLEILALPHQLQVLQPSPTARTASCESRPVALGLLSAAWSGWRAALVIVKPETVHAPDGALPEAAVVEAAYQTLRFFLPRQASTLEAAHFEAIGTLGSTLAVRDRQRVGEMAADVVSATA